MTDNALLALRRQMASDLPTAGDEDRALLLCQAAELGDVAAVQEILEWPLPKSWVEQALAGAEWVDHAEALTTVLPTFLDALKGRNLAHVGFREVLGQVAGAGAERAMGMLLDHAGMHHLDHADTPRPGLLPTLLEENQLISVLTTMVRQGRRSMVQDLLRRGAASRSMDFGPLHAAIERGDAAILDDLMDARKTPILPAIQHDLLVEAAQNGHLACVQRLWINPLPDLVFAEALKKAASAGHLPVVESLVTRGTTGFLAALNEAAAQGHLPVIEVLMNLTDPSQKDSAPLLQAIVYGHWAAFDMLLPVSVPTAFHLGGALSHLSTDAEVRIRALIPRCDVMAGAASLVQLKHLDRLDRLASLCPSDLRGQLLRAFPEVDLPRTQAQIRHEHLSSREPVRPSRRTRS